MRYSSIRPELIGLGFLISSAIASQHEFLIYFLSLLRFMGLLMDSLLVSCPTFTPRVSEPALQLWLFSGSGAWSLFRSRLALEVMGAWVRSAVHGYSVYFG